MINLIPSYLESYRFQLSSEALRRRLFQAERRLHHKGSEIYWQALEEHPEIQTREIVLDQDVVKIGAKEEADAKQRERILKHMQVFSPWRKGPFSIFGTEIDAEWRSNLKWSRILPFLDPLTDKKICDVGCNNGYFIFRMQSQQPELVVGLEPVPRYKFTFEYLKKFTPLSNLFLEPLGYEELPLYLEFFDSLFLMGIIYHHQDPISILQKAWQALKPGGQIIVDSIGIDSKEEYILFPGKRYAKAAGVWFLPSEKALLKWLERSHFTDIRCIFNEELSLMEQRRTQWSSEESLEDFLDPDNPAKTVEGFPRPRRIYFLARKKKK